MDGIHDMGALAGFGPVDVDDVEATHEPWEARAQVVALLGGDGMRAAIEAIPPGEYLAAGYYERWLVSAERRCVESGRLGADDLERWRSAFDDDPGLRPPHRESKGGVDGLVDLLTTTSPMPPAADPRFDVGDRVRVRRMRPEVHHRCPRYVRGAIGVVERVAGDEHVPRAGPGQPDGPLEAVYTVRFDSTELWGDRREAGEPPYELLIDLWERYVEAA
jgi:nitrile hydratase